MTDLDPLAFRHAVHRMPYEYVVALFETVASLIPVAELTANDLGRRVALEDHPGVVHIGTLTEVRHQDDITWLTVVGPRIENDCAAPWSYTGTVASDYALAVLPTEDENRTFRTIRFPTGAPLIHAEWVQAVTPPPPFDDEYVPPIRREHPTAGAFFEAARTPPIIVTDAEGNEREIV